MTRIATVLAIALLPSAAAAQPTPTAHGLVGGIAFGFMRWDLAQRSVGADKLGGLSAGYRIALGTANTSPLTLTPHISLLMTEFRGIALHSDQVAVSRFDAGLELAARWWPVHPFVVVQAGRITTEQYVDTNLVNYSGGMPAYGGGIRWQRNNDCGAGPEIQVRRTRGELESGEWRLKDTVPPPAGQFSAWIVTAGWSGRFRGTRLLFACH